MKIICATADENQEFFSWVLKHPDTEVRGRQWVVELGLKVESSSSHFSCVVNTEESSTLVSEPVKVSRPKIISYIISNIQSCEGASFDTSVPGVGLKSVGESAESIRGMLYEVENESRDHPIVLVSPDRDGFYSIDETRLQKYLIGLAQVVKIVPDFDSYEMEEVLGKRWSAWDEAVNIIHVRTSSGYIRSKLFLSNVIEEWGETQHSRISNILAWVIHNTNIPRLRNRIRPEGVLSLSIKQGLEKANERRGELNADELRKEINNLAVDLEYQREYMSLL